MCDRTRWKYLKRLNEGRFADIGKQKWNDLSRKPTFCTNTPPWPRRQVDETWRRSCHVSLRNWITPFILLSFHLDYFLPSAKRNFNNREGIKMKPTRLSLRQSDGSSELLGVIDCRWISREIPLYLPPFLVTHVYLLPPVLFPLGFFFHCSRTKKK